MVDGVMSKFLKRVEGGRAAARFALLERGPAHTARAARAARHGPRGASRSDDFALLYATGKPFSGKLRVSEECQHCR
jgi:hypothetical protein